MSDAEASTPLSQVERVVDTFIAPTKTFHDILRDSSWWLPWLLGVLVTLGFGLAIKQKIGWDKTYSNILLQSPQSQQDRLAQLPPDQRGRNRKPRSIVCKIHFLDDAGSHSGVRGYRGDRSPGYTEFRAGRPRKV